jgi:hypothetical protein
MTGTTIEEATAHLVPFGLEVRRQAATCTAYWNVEADGYLVEVGELIFWRSGKLIVYPRADATDAQKLVLLGSAERALSGEDRPSAATGWRYRRDKLGARWIANVIVELRPWEPLHTLLAATWERPLEVDA